MPLPILLKRNSSHSSLNTLPGLISRRIDSWWECNCSRTASWDLAKWLELGEGQEFTERLNALPAIPFHLCLCPDVPKPLPGPRLSFFTSAQFQSGFTQTRHPAHQNHSQDHESNCLFSFTPDLGCLRLDQPLPPHSPPRGNASRESQMIETRYQITFSWTTENYHG